MLRKDQVTLVWGLAGSHSSYRTHSASCVGCSAGHSFASVGSLVLGSVRIEGSARAW